MSTPPRRSFPQQPLCPEGVDFLATTFPERAFPPLEAAAESYGRACRRGYAVMARSRVAITGLARNLAAVLPLTIRRIETLAGCFADCRVVVFENDSTDGTRDVLRRWAAADRRITLSCEDCRDPVNPATRCLERADRMARYRRRCQELVLDSCGGFAFTIVVDLDMLGGWSIDGLASTFGHDGWDFVGSNGLVLRRRGLAINHLQQYDTWALRFDPGLTPLSTVVAAAYVYGRGEPLVPVTSCFGGLGVYTMAAYAAGRYETGEIEHATFHRSLRAAGRDRLFLNPSQIVVHGRRHRKGDRLVEALLQRWEGGCGRRRSRLLVPRAAVPSAAGESPARRAAA
ncbi:MAG: hypothetical protein ACKO4T_10800 [Planctomycetaceae bacterium]